MTKVKEFLKKRKWHVAVAGVLVIALAATLILTLSAATRETSNGEYPYNTGRPGDDQDSNGDDQGDEENNQENGEREDNLNNSENQDGQGNRPTQSPNRTTPRPATPNPTRTPVATPTRTPLLTGTPSPHPSVSERDFVLKISVEETTLPQGKNFMVNIELRNNSGQDLEIAHAGMFFPFLTGAEEYLAIESGDNRPWPDIIFIEKGGSFTRNMNLSRYYDTPQQTGIPQGVYKLSVGAVFHVGWEQPPPTENGRISWGIRDSAQRIRIYSNTIELTVQ